jgi:predicted nucleic acid-binding protein
MQKMQNGYALNPQTNRIIKKSTAMYRKLVKLGVISDVIEPLVAEEPSVEKVEKVEKVEVVKAEKVEKVEYDEKKLQLKLADLSTNLINENLQKIVKSQKLSDDEMNTLLKKMLYTKLCLDPPKPQKPQKTKKVKKSKFKLVEPSSSDSESESE